MSQLLWNVCFGELIRRVTEDCLFFFQRDARNRLQLQKRGTRDLSGTCEMRIQNNTTHLSYVFVLCYSSSINALHPHCTGRSQSCRSCGSLRHHNTKPLHVYVVVIDGQLHLPHTHTLTAQARNDVLRPSPLPGEQLPSMGTFKPAATKDVWNNGLTLLFYM